MRKITPEEEEYYITEEAEQVSWPNFALILQYFSYLGSKKSKRLKFT